MAAVIQEGVIMRKRKRFYHIYLISFKNVGGKEFIGISKHPLRRIKDHLTIPTSRLFKIKEKLGEPEWFILHRFLTKEEALKLEREEITHRKTLYPNGYNTDIGGYTGIARTNTPGQDVINSRLERIRRKYIRSRNQRLKIVGEYLQQRTSRTPS